MSELPAKEPSFEDAIIAKLRKDIGELMPDEALRKVINLAIERIFLNRKKDTYGRETGPSWLEAEVFTLMKPIIEKQVKEYMVAHPDAVEKAVQTALGNQATDLFKNAINNILYQVFQPLQQQVTKLLTS